MRWVASSKPSNKAPLWARSAALADDGTVFIPAAIAGNEMRTVLAATWDSNVPMVIDSGHAYLPSTWMARECPRNADICELIERRVREHFAKPAEVRS